MSIISMEVMEMALAVKVEMNWRQLYTASTTEERFELLLEMFRRLEARRFQLLTSHYPLSTVNRQPAHWVGT